ncbi:hypothetical protein ACIO3O_35950 [Streptomyces sp. NPDC087440]|uniref:hypothetical protein n=1 Tax=Streptomyces sp. NPDC087440 TaxID=3365790 RepID=UPI003814476A
MIPPVAWLLMLPTAAMRAFGAVAPHDSGREYAFRIGFGGYVKPLIGGSLYAVVLAPAALRAVDGGGKRVRGDP